MLFFLVSEETLSDQPPSFYDLQAMPGAQELSRRLDSHSPAIFIPDFLVFGDEIVKTIHVSMKLISLSPIPTSTCSES